MGDRLQAKEEILLFTPMTTLMGTSTIILHLTICLITILVISWVLEAELMELWIIILVEVEQFAFEQLLFT